jgi:hypothetical protein
MSVHKELAQHAKQQNLIYQTFLQLDDLREHYIEEAILLCQKGEPFSTNKINEITNQINKINLRFIPERKMVTDEMIKAFVNKE